jgi:hypothetical protein
MCVIIHRPAGLVLPVEVIEKAAHANQDGYGLAVADRGKLEVVKVFTNDDPPVDEILKRLDDAKDQEIVLHCRIATVGEKNFDNCHPFPVLNREEHGLDLVLFHNGTFSYYRDAQNKHSDTYWLTKRVVSPLMQKIYETEGVNEWSSNDLLRATLGGIAVSSRIVMFDGNGTRLTINKKEGKEYEIDGQKWWASNDWFMTRHVPKEKRSKIYQGKWNDYEDNGHYKGRSWNYKTNSWEEALQEEGGPRRDMFPGLPRGSTPKTTAIPFSNNNQETSKSGSKHHKNVTPQHIPQTNNRSGGTVTCFADYLARITPVPTKYEKAEAHTLEQEAEKVKEGMSDIMLNERPNPDLLNKIMKERPTFVELAGIDSLFDVTRMEREDLGDLVNGFPEMSIILIMDLLDALYIRRGKVEREILKALEAEQSKEEKVGVH